MNQDISHLSPMQKTCLRLVYSHLKSKDIARQLGLSPHTIESHIKSARIRLGAATRLDAARILIEHEEQTPHPQQSVSLPIGIADLITIAPSPIGDIDRGTGGLGQPSRQPWGAESPLYKILPLPQEWGETNDLSIATRLWWIVALTILICLSLGAVMTSLQTLGSLI